MYKLYNIGDRTEACVTAAFCRRWQLAFDRDLEFSVGKERANKLNCADREA
jgi:hypothetical protein